MDISSVTRRQAAAKKQKPEEIVAEASFEEYDSADVNGKLKLFFEIVGREKPEPFDVMDMAATLHDDPAMRREPTVRMQFNALVERLRQEQPAAYEQQQSAYLRMLIANAISDRRWDRLQALLDEYAPVIHKDLDGFTRTRDMREYHGQTRPLLAAMQAAWPEVRDATDDILPWGHQRVCGRNLETALPTLYGGQRRTTGR